MKISYNWLKQFIKIDWEADKIAELLTDLGLEVEGVEPFETVKGGLKGVVVGHVLECTKHPNADKLSITKVDLGDGNPVQIVCGAANVAVGQKVPVATIGTVLYDSNGQPWEIKKGKIRGEESHGMICAEDELGLGNSHEGIMVLDAKLKPGTPCAQVFNVETDAVFEIGLTPNRADAMSHFGVARDLRAGLAQKTTAPQLLTPSVSSFHVDNRLLKIDVSIENKELCPRYCGVTISGLSVKESPDWLKNRLKSIGLTPKNNVVDATNYVLHELGQPLHAFDADKISGGKILVKTLPAGTKFITLEGTERELHQEDLMICDADKPLCIAGVFGGLNSGVTETTTKIFLESAYFNPVSVRKSAKRHGLSTDASFRFERGIDVNNTKYALQRAALLIQEVAGGKISSDVIDLYPKKIDDFQVVLSFSKVNALIGEEIPRETIKAILTSLDIKINNVTETGLGLTIPSYRVDVQREADVIEEILRVYGYNRIGFKQKINASIPTASRFEDHRIQNITGGQLASLGFFEMMANSLTSPAYTTLSASLNPEYGISLVNPLSNELSVLRQSMLFSGLEAVSFNINRKKETVKLFEFGKTYHQYQNGREEQKHLSLFVTGKAQEAHWGSAAKQSNFFYLKGIVETLLERLGINGLKTVPAKSDIFAEGISLLLGKTMLAELGTVNKKILKHFDIKQEVLFADLHWDKLLTLIESNHVKFTDIPKYPEVRRDLALLLDTKVTFEEVYTTALQSERKLLKDVTLFDVYEGKNLPEGKKSYAVSFTLLDEEKTLNDKEIDKVMAKLQQSFEKQLGATLRS